MKNAGISGFSFGYCIGLTGEDLEVVVGLAIIAVM